MADDNGTELDQILDSGLKGYSTCEPLAGLEERLLNRIRLAGIAPRRNSPWWWLLALPMVGLVALVPTALRVYRPEPVTPPSISAVIKPPAMPAIEPEAPRLARVSRRKIVARALPKQPIFPMPTPMTAEERALVAFVQQHPKEAKEQFAALEKEMRDPVRIEALEVPPIEIKQLQENDDAKSN